MKILVVGAGATGGYFGSRLAQAGHEVTFLVRKKRAQHLSQTGLVVHAFDGTFTFKPELILAEQLANKQWDLVLIAVKNHQLAELVEQLRPAVGAATTVLPILNGMGHLTVLQQAFGDRVIGGLCQIYATLNEQQEVVQYTALDRLHFGALTPTQIATVTHIAEQLQDVNFALKLSEDIQSEMWEKWLFLSVLGAATSLARGNTQQIVSAKGGASLIAGLFAEVLAIITAAGYQQRPAIVAKLLATLSDPNTPLVSSLYRDLIAGNATESEAIIGALIEKADQFQQPAVLLNACWVQLQVAETSRLALASKS